MSALLFQAGLNCSTELSDACLRVLILHGLIFKTSVYVRQNQPGALLCVLFWVLSVLYTVTLCVVCCLCARSALRPVPALAPCLSGPCSAVFFFGFPECALSARAGCSAVQGVVWCGVVEGGGVGKLVLVAIDCDCF